MERDRSRRRSQIKALIVFVATLFGAGVVLGLARNSSPFVMTVMTTVVVAVGAYVLLATLRRGGRSGDDQ